LSDVVDIRHTDADGVPGDRSGRTEYANVNELGYEVRLEVALETV